MRFVPFGLCLLLLLSAPPAPAQSGADDGSDAPAPRAADLLQHGDSAEAAWLRASVPAPELDALFADLAALSVPGAVQLLPGHFYADPSFAYLQALPAVYDSVEILLGELRRRPPPGERGRVHAAYRLARIRGLILEAYADLPFYQLSFLGEPLRLVPRELPPHSLSLHFDFAPARALLDAVSGTSGAAELPSGPVIEAVLRHRRQSFYPVEMSREALELSLARAASDAPLDRLYRYAFPLGLFHLAEVREHRQEYRRLVDTLEAREAELTAHVLGIVAPYVPRDLEFSRTIHFLFADGADGWVSDGVPGIDLEYFKDDYDRLLTLIAHETYHALQDAAREGDALAYPDLRRRLLAGVMDAVYREGTATFVASPNDLTDEEHRAAAARGAELLAAIQRELDRPGSPSEDAVRGLRDQGVQGAGPFYSLGREMSAVIVSRLGADALAGTLRHGGVAFFRAYLEAERRTAGSASLLPAEVVRALESL